MVQTREFKNGLNFFQKAILRFKSRPGFKDEDIARLIGVDEKLIHIISSELKLEKMLDENGALTDKGRTARMMMDGIIVDNDKTRTGYVFQYINEDRYYPFYVDNYRKPDTIKDKGEIKILGQKGDGYSMSLFSADEILESCKVLPAPDEQRIARLIKNIGKYGIEFSDNVDTRVSGDGLSVKLLPDNKPTLVWVCTYMYYKNEGNGLYSSDWKVIDPFIQPDPNNQESMISYRDSKSIKLYIEGNAPQLVSDFESRFVDIETLERRKYQEMNVTLDKVIEERMRTDFGFLPANMDKTLLGYLHRIVRSKIRIDYHDDIEDASVSFSANLQRALESILIKHRYINESIYQQIAEAFEPNGNSKEDKWKKGQALNDLYQYLFHKQAPVPLYLTSKKSIKTPDSLKAYISSFLLTRMYGDKLYMMVLRDCDILLEISDIRNNRAHGHIDEDNSKDYLTSQQVDAYYGFIVRFINEYINI